MNPLCLKLALREGTSDRRQERGNVCRVTFLHGHFPCVHARPRHLDRGNVAYNFRCGTFGEILWSAY
jgi:hypothetical protein